MAIVGGDEFEKKKEKENGWKRQFFSDYDPL